MRSIALASFCFGCFFMTDLLLSCRIKLDRAAKHFNDLNAEIDAFKDRQPYRAVVDEDSEPAVKIYKLHIVEAIPLKWAGHVGDIIHNTRATLDSLATALVIRGGHTSKKAIDKAKFPICATEAGLSEARVNAFFKYAGPSVEKMIRRLQPYREGKGCALWRLHRLDIIDKHRAIIPVGANLLAVQASNQNDPVARRSPGQFFPALLGLEVEQS